MSSIATEAARSPASAAPSGGTARGVAFGVGAGALWGFAFLAPQLAGDFSSFQLSVARYLCFGLMAALLLAPRWRAVTSLLSRRDWLQLGVLAFIGNTLHYLLVSSAVQLGGIAMTSLVIGFLPVTVTIIGSRDHGALPLRKLAPSLLWCAAATICIGWSSLGAASASPHPVLGLLCALGGLATWTAFAVSNTRMLARLERVDAQDWNLLTGVMTGAQNLLLVPLVLLLGGLGHANADWARFAGVAMGLAFVASILGNALWNRMSRLLPLTLVGQMILFQTLFALLYGWLWEQRSPTPLELASLAIVAMSVLTCLSAHRTEK